MTDIDDAHRSALTAFGIDQMVNNPAGIGNECTHWIYAALFEARALDRDRALHIAQTHNPYTWGRRVQAPAARPGDITQFHNFHNRFGIFVRDASGGGQYLTAHKIRGPRHTGMVFIAPSQTTPRTGVYMQLESHLHEPGHALMSIRGNLIYHETFAVALTAAELAQAQSDGDWPAAVNSSVIEDMLEKIDWTRLRANHTISAHDAQGAVAQIHHGQSPVLNGVDMAVVFRVQTSGDLRFYCPQASPARLAMNAAQLAAEKASVSAMMRRSGRRGHNPAEDSFGGDNRAQRIRDHRFDWTFAQPGLGTLFTALQRGLLN